MSGSFLMNVPRGNGMLSDSIQCPELVIDILYAVSDEIRVPALGKLRYSLR